MTKTPLRAESIVMTMTHPNLASGLRRLALASLVLASTGPIALADGPGADQDSAYNLYTASVYPNSAKMRMSKRSATNSSVIVKDVAVSSGYTMGSQQYPLVKCDKNGGAYAAVPVGKSDGSEGIAIFHLSSTGATSVVTFEQQTTTSGQTSIRAIGVDPSGNLFVVYDCSTSLGGGPFYSYLRKYSSSLASLGTRVIPVLPSDGSPAFSQSAIAIDSAGYVYVEGADTVTGGVNAGTYVAITKYANDGTSGPVWQHWTNAPAYAIGGPLTLDGSGRLTCLATYTSPTNQNLESTYPIQFSPLGAVNWQGPGVDGFNATDAAVDANSDVLFLGNQVNPTPMGTQYYYTVAKVSGQTGSLTWSTSLSPNPTGASIYSLGLVSLMVDADNDAFAVTTSGTSTSAKVEIDRFASASGQDIGTYVYNSGNPASLDYGAAIFSWSSVYTYFIAGVGSPTGNGTYYPLAFRFGTGYWQDYQTATTP